MEESSLSWLLLNDIASFIAAAEGVGTASYCLARTKGAKQYRMVVRLGSRNVDVLSWLDEHPSSRALFKQHGYHLDTEAFTAFATELMMKDSWRAHYNAKEQWTQSAQRPVTPKTFGGNPWLHRHYWQALLANDIQGCPEDQWPRVLRDHLQSPPTPSSKKAVQEQLQKMALRKTPWEFHADQSLRYWASAQPKWTKILDTWHISYRQRHDGSLFVLHALEQGWVDGLKGWVDETQSHLHAFVLPDDVPSSWPVLMSNTLEEHPTGSLWHWAFAVSPLTTLQSLVSLYDNVWERDRVDTQGNNVLHWACASQRADVITWLACQCPDLMNHENHSGKLPSEYLNEEHDDLFDWIEEFRLKGFNPKCQKEKCINTQYHKMEHNSIAAPPCS